VPRGQGEVPNKLRDAADLATLRLPKIWSFCDEPLMDAAAAILVATLGATAGGNPTVGTSGPCVPLHSVAPGWQSGEANDSETHARVTHSYPRWPWPAVFESSRPTFLVRLNRLVEPRQILALVQITPDGRSRSGRLHDGRFPTGGIVAGEQRPDVDGRRPPVVTRSHGKPWGAQRCLPVQRVPYL
jgi:hypothetical protein